MEFNTFVRKPFVVEAVEVTEENIAEIAQFVGTLREKDNGSPYIQVDRRLVPNLYRVFPGFWMTRMGDNIRCYSKKIFNNQFIQTTPEIQDWVDYMSSPKVASELEDEASESEDISKDEPEIIPETLTTVED